MLKARAANIYIKTTLTLSVLLLSAFCLSQWNSCCSDVVYLPVIVGIALVADDVMELL